MGTKALMEQRCVNQHGMGIYTVVILSKDEDENSRLIKHKMIPIKERELQTIIFYHMAHKKEEGTYHCNEKCLDSSAPGKACLS